MNAPASLEDLTRDLAAIEAELVELDQRDAQLQSALEDVEHDTRRSNDALERAGWRSIKAEARGSMLAQSRRAIVDDRKKNGLRRGELIERLSAIRQRLNGNEDDD